jgi:hypothetical protein
MPDDVIFAPPIVRNALPLCTRGRVGKNTGHKDVLAIGGRIHTTIEDDGLEAFGGLHSALNAILLALGDLTARGARPGIGDDELATDRGSCACGGDESEG